MKTIRCYNLLSALEAPDYPAMGSSASGRAPSFLGTLILLERDRRRTGRTRWVNQARQAWTTSPGIFLTATGWTLERVRVWCGV